MSEIKSIGDYKIDRTGKTDVTDIIQNCIDEIDAAGGGHLIFPAGIYQCGSLKLCSHLVFEVTAGAEIHFTTDVQRYPTISARWEGKEQVVYRACLYGDNINNVQITGAGLLEGQGQIWWQRFNQHELAYPRPYLISIENSERVTIENLRLQNSPSWTVHPINSKQVLIQNLAIINPSDSPNTDGINPESCQQVKILACNIDVGDDCIAIKAGTEAAREKIPCEDIIIANCSMNHGHGGVVLGSEMSGDIRRVIISNCVFHETDRGIRMKTRRGRGGVIEDVNVNNILMDHVICPIVLNTYYDCGENGKQAAVADRSSYPVTEATPYYRHFNINNVTAKQVGACAMFIYGLPEAPLEDIMLSHITIELNQQAHHPVAPAMIKDAPKLAGEKIYIENTQNVTFDHVMIDRQTTDLMYHEVNNLNLKYS